MTSHSSNFSRLLRVEKIAASRTCVWNDLTRADAIGDLFARAHVAGCPRLVARSAARVRELLGLARERRDSQVSHSRTQH
jgi:hypothetical protein